ncbi:hypothetical protein SteCoe_31611 [Stentor coeruleus]|uniref:Uncharacterized protein n=1 Tax=Stentor coeruleus TaxID=5963 RepID=A0A1R2B163_9CILI|nr:hypothetical protein SteCoe_31611 [Stentor coeruleus]
MEILYDEQLIIDSGLNIKICQGIYFTDLLRLEYNEEITHNLGYIYLDYLIKNTNYTLSYSLPTQIPDFIITLFPNWSIFIKSKHFYQGIYISSVSSSLSLKMPIQNLCLNCTSMISYKILGLASLYLTLKNPIIFLESFKKAKFHDLGLKLANDLKDFILVMSKIPSKTLYMDIEEAKEILRPCQKKRKYWVFIKPAIEISMFQVKNSTKINGSLYEIGENSESMEYSPTQNVNEFVRYSINNYEKVSNKTPSFVVSEHQITEEPTQKKTILELNESINSYKLLPTPINSPKQSSFTIDEIKQMVNFGVSNHQVCDKNSLISETKNFDGKEIFSCSYCLIY